MIYIHFKSSGRLLISLLFLCFFLSSSVYSQEYRSPSQALVSSPVEGNLHIIGVMVEFQPDDNRFTSGNGTFRPGSIPYLDNPGTTIDALPHNRPYFEAHLQFSKNYFNRMSDGALDIEYYVLPDILRLDQEMAHYSPVGEYPDLSQLSELTRDVWESVAEMDIQIPTVQPGDNIAFVIFHAGVGRDRELSGTTLDRTPQDIPSVYLSRQSLSSMLNDPSFSGFPVQNGDILVTNNLIIPRTLSRSGEDITGNRFVLPLSINGMLTAQLGSHLGLPDLFNTETGESGIGRFGLMDGAGIFAYNGLFPPELSAWEKIHMGWADPFEVSYNRAAPVSLPASALDQPNSIAKIPLSNREYFLVENRHREASETGTELTIRRPDGSFVTQSFSNNDTTFVFQLSGFSDELEPGVVVDVSNYDFALPGGPAEVLEETGSGDERILNGGILIWHIDEGIIQQRLAANRGINDDPDEKGVRLMEADGAQDIGRPTAIGFFENEVNGSAFDFWWSGNDASVITATQTISLYENRFGPETTPNNDRNSGAESQFELFDFSDNLPFASVSIREPESDDLYEVIDFIQNLPLSHSTPADEAYWSGYPLSSFTLESEAGSYVYLPARDGVSVYDLEENSLLPPATLYQTLQQPFLNPGSGVITAAPNPALESNNFSVALLETSDAGLSQSAVFAPSLNRGLIGSPAAGILQLDGTSDRIRLSSEMLEPDFYSADGFRSAQIQGYESFVANDGSATITTPTDTYSTSVLLPGSGFGRVHIGLFEREDGEFGTYVLSGPDIFILDTEPGSDLQPRSIHSSGSIGWPALVDIDRSGDIDFLFVDKSSNLVLAKNTNGAILSGFPIEAPD